MKFHTILHELTKKAAESVPTSTTLKVGNGTSGNVEITINVNRPSAPENTTRDLLEDLSPKALAARGVSEDTIHSIEKQKGILDSLLAHARQAVEKTKGTTEAIQSSKQTTAENALGDVGRSVDALGHTPTFNKYNLQDRFTNSGILGTSSQPNDGSGTSMIAYKELLGRLLNKSMKNNSADIEVSKLRSDNPWQEYT